MQYTNQYYKISVNDEALTSSNIIVPLVISIIHPKSVVDVGCGQGAWLKRFKRHTEDFFGVDGFHINEDSLLIDKSKFKKVDLEKRLHLERRFDLVVSLEVAEHLTPERGPSFISDLTKLGDTVLFSAAIPNQGGYNHKNLKWQSYWQELFAEKGYTSYDIIRPIIWNNDNISICYRQNTILYSKKNISTQQPKPIVDIVHPQMLDLNSQWLNRTRAIRKLFHLDNV